MWRTLVSKGETGGRRLSKDAERDCGRRRQLLADAAVDAFAEEVGVAVVFYPEGRAERGEPFARHFPPGKPSPAPDPPSCPRPRPVSLDRGRVVVFLARYPGRLDSVTNGCGAAWA
jgi:hypothetical protein